MNLATIDSEVYDKSGLPPVSQYPTIMLVGKDKKPAVFKDEVGAPTNSFPRKPTLEQDFHSLKTLVTQTPLDKVTPLEKVTPLPSEPMPSMTMNSEPMKSGSMPYVKISRSMNAANSLISKRNNSNSMVRETSPYDKEETVIPSKISEPIRSEPIEAYSEKTVFTPPKVSEDVSSTAVRSQVPGSLSGIAASLQLQRGGLLKSITDYTQSLKTVLKMRAKKNNKRKTRRR